ncbi:hypothetical protein [Methanothermococcus okinawensis]|uniref:Uncharacterized protein n=1 Tax=Methanothermococcus okinawensis (strain DSM 14208 / JCM 11175 / IH1) TaxID=647113 RepID=F8ALK1_METOI|nr:hypothetical protein [Methanothermococcus okinawensis]AEH07207.1 hypothetical protein Metok_1239 [Methanothermococcus okinawensis IH1]
MKVNKLLIIPLLFLMLISENFALNDVVIKLTPDNIETDGNLVKFNITVENIPPKESLGMPSGYDDSKIKDGGCQGVDICINYSNDYLSPIGFNWSDKYKDVKIKEYHFENGTFFLSIMFDEPIYDSSINLGTIVFNPIKKGKTNLNVSGKVSSEYGIKYDSHNQYYIDYGGKSGSKVPYPDTKFYGATVNIKKTGNYTGSTNLNGELNENTVSSSSSTTINKINIITNQSMPEIIVKEVNISEEKPNITVIINSDGKSSLNYNLLISIFIGSILSGIIFGLIFRRMIL